MVNENTQGVISLVGRGHVRHPRGNYQPGEFKSLVNCEMNKEGAIINRRPIRSIVGAIDNPTAYDPITYDLVDINGFVGHYKHGVISAGMSSHKMYWNDPAGPDMVDLWDPADLQTGLAAGDFRLIVGFIRYNKINYWITWTYIAATKKFYYDLYYAADPAGLDIKSITFVMLTKVAIFDTVTDPHEDAPVLRAFFIHKERLWIVTQFKAYFSKATDPTVWSVPDGGFFNFLEAQINDACALRDSVYIIADSSTHAITYSADPNTDATVRQLTDGLGGDSCTIHSDTVYFIRDEQLHSITNSSVTKELDVNVRVEYQTNCKWRLFTFGKYIVAVFSKLSKHGSPSTDIDENYNNQVEWPNLKKYHWISESTPDYTVFFINMDLASIHAVEYSNTGGTVADLYFSSIEDGNNEQRLYFLCQGVYTFGTTKSSVSYMLLNQDETDEAECYDTVLSPTTYRWGSNSIPILLEIDSYAPDSSEFFMKKFRTLLLEGQLFNNTAVTFTFDSNLLSDEIVIAGYDSLQRRPPAPSRIPINQRARALSISIYSDDPSPSVTTFLITRLVVLWSYTGRGPTNQKPSRSDI